MLITRHANGKWSWIQEDTRQEVPESAVISAMTGQQDSLSDLFSQGKPSVPDSLSGIAPPLIDGMEVWAAGVTYESSKFARMAESEGGGDFYAKVYVADRPELFFKATPRRVVGDGGSIRVRQDSTWNVPEPELAVLVNAKGSILGYSIGNDVSSRDIEGTNPLYLPQAKVYTGSCALGPGIVLAEDVDPHTLPVRLTIHRSGAAIYQGETSTSTMKRKVDELVDWLFRENDFPMGVWLFTGTGLIPPDNVSLSVGDRVKIEIGGIGILENTVAP